jgi:putative selenate reductase molybdopterin-binding subunit
MDEVAHRLGMDPFAFRRRNVVRPGDPMVSSGEAAHDVEYGSYGLDQCLDLVEGELTSVPSPNVDADWLVGRGMAVGMIDTVPPRGHFADAAIRLAEDGYFELTVGTAEFGNGTTTVHVQIAAELLGTVPDRVRIRQSDTAHGGHDTGAYGSTGTVVAGAATAAAARTLANTMRAFATAHLERDASDPLWRPDTLRELATKAGRAGVLLEATGQNAGSPRSVAFNVQAFEVAVHRRYGTLQILHSIHAADAGRVINPMQCRAQVEGGVAQAIGAALYEELKIDHTGTVINPAFRGYHVPAFADVPRTTVLFADTYDTVGPLGAKSMSESPYNPVAAALGNAIRDATGLRLRETPFSADRICRALLARGSHEHVSAAPPEP